MVFIFQFVNVVYYIDWFVDIEKSLHSCNESHLIMVYDCLIYWIGSILLMIFTSVFISDIGL